MDQFIVGWLSCLLLSLPVMPPERGQIIVDVKNLKNQKGTVRALLYRSSQGFPDDLEQAFKMGEASATVGQVTIRFADLPYGTYAVTLLHDENDNGEMDKNFLGIPKEGYGFSNNARGLMGPPDFEETAFELNSENKQIEVSLNY